MDGPLENATTRFTLLKAMRISMWKRVMNGNFADDIVAIQKPYGLAMFGEDLQHSVEKYLPALAESLGCQTLHQVHRLDKITSGILLLAKVYFSYC